MKKIFILLFLFSFSKVFSQAQDSAQKFSLDLKGQIKFGKQNLDSTTVYVYDDTTSTIVTQITSDVKGWVAFAIPLKRFFVVKFTKPGYVTKIITIDTHVPKTSKGNYFFGFSIDLFEEIPELDVSVLKHPIAKIFFNTFTKKFDYDYNYTAKINERVKEMYRKYFLLKKEGKGIQAKVSQPDTAATPIAPRIPDTLVADTSRMMVADTAEKYHFSKIIFSVQVLAVTQPASKNGKLFRQFKNVKDYKDKSDNLYKYYIGEFSNYEDAKKMLDSIRPQIPKADAFIIVFKDGKRIPAREAIEFRK
ncbi:MAG: hypothetical protein HY063_05485 [Bacteroidetes bacterium]|nr:hypothetical protein [Bacteroidota bacterium]